ncbi:MAG: lipopolysaccharide biosynthesis protein [Gammaproteobacteria bacterium]
MFYRHNSRYLCWGLLASFLGCFTIILFTHFLDPHSYSYFTLTLSTVTLLVTVSFHWLDQSLVRYYPKCHTAEKQANIVSNLLSLLFLLLLLLCSVFFFIYNTSPLLKNYFSLAYFFSFLLLFFSMAPNNFLQNIFRVRFQIDAYGIFNGLRYFLSLLLGLLFLKRGYGAAGALLGFSTAYLYTHFLLMRYIKIKITPLDPSLCLSIARYGLPFVITFTLQFIIATSDRFLIAKFLGQQSAGIYGASADLLEQSLVTFLGVINLGSLPLLAAAFEAKDTKKTKSLFRKNSYLLISYGFPLTLFFILLNKTIAHYFLAPAYTTAAQQLIPYIALTQFVLCMKSYHFDLYFLLNHDTMKQMWITLFIALLNIVINIVFIPYYGIQGAAIGSLFSASLGLLIAYLYTIPLSHNSKLLYSKG